MAKYKIGQEVRLLFDPNKRTCLHIAEIQEITCSAGTQTFYIGRMWYQKEYSKDRFCARESCKVNEIEVAAVKEVKTKKAK